jgi:hypothetical protein
MLAAALPVGSTDRMRRIWIACVLAGALTATAVAFGSTDHPRCHTAHGRHRHHSRDRCKAHHRPHRKARHRHKHPGGPTTTPTTPTPGGGGGGQVPCPLTHAAGANAVNSCWATNTGVQAGTGYTEAQIQAGQSTLKHVTGDVTITTPGTTISNEWISGCIAIDANNVTIKDSLITPNGDTCSGGNHGSASSAINDGDVGSSNSPTGILVQNVTVDAGPSQGPGTAGDTFGVSLASGQCLRCNSFGFAKDFWLDGTASHPALLQDSYAPSLESCAPVSTCTHMDNIFLDSSTYVTVEHSYAITTNGGGNATGALDAQQDWGPIDHVKLDRSYLEGIEGVDVEWSCGATNSAITNTAFSSDNGYNSTDYIDYYNTNPGDTWSGNYIPETGARFRDPSPAYGC